jgi:DNA-binding NarL/FixJ family response regulator
MAIRKTRIKVLIVDDHPVVVSGCISVLNSDQFDVVSASDALSGYEVYRKQKPTVALFDVKLPDVSGLELLRKVLQSDPGARVVMFSMNNDPALVVRALELGAKGYICKSSNPRALAGAIKSVAAGETFLSAEVSDAAAIPSASIRANPMSQLRPRELEIVRLLAKGRKIGQVADALGLSYKTVANTTSLLKQKLGAQSHSDLIRLAYELNLN